MEPTTGSHLAPAQPVGQPVTGLAVAHGAPVFATGCCQDINPRARTPATEPTAVQSSPAFMI